MRHKLMWSFYRQYQLEGMTREEVEKLLGKGDDLQGSVEYKLADDWIGGWRVYHIDYKQDRVIRAKKPGKTGENELFLPLKSSIIKV